MLTVRFVDHSEEIAAKLQRKLAAAVAAAAEVLADGYKFGLQRTIAPKHSAIGEIPHAYLGWKPGGYGPTNPTGINNIPPEFAREQSDFLSNYISWGTANEFGAAAFIGFEQGGHVVTRDQNYLLEHNSHGRPWVYPIYEDERGAMANAAKSQFEGTS